MHFDFHRLIKFDITLIIANIIFDQSRLSDRILHGGQQKKVII